MKSADAEILASSLSPEQRRVFQVVCGKVDHIEEVDPCALVILVELGLVRRERSIEESPRELVVLTQRGRKVAQFL